MKSCCFRRSLGGFSVNLSRHMERLPLFNVFVGSLLLLIQPNLCNIVRISKLALGSHYITRYELLLPFINQTDLSDIEVLAEGRNGRVFCALWNRPPVIPGGHGGVIPIVLKHIHAKSGVDDDSPLLKFLHEVCP